MVDEPIPNSFNVWCRAMGVEAMLPSGEDEMDLSDSPGNDGKRRPNAVRWWIVVSCWAEERRMRRPCAAEKIRND